MNIINLSGEYVVELADGSKHCAVLPGTLDENRIGYRDKAGTQWHPAEGLGEADTRNSLLSADVITTRLTRKYTYEGAAAFYRNFEYGTAVSGNADAHGKGAAGKAGRVFFEFERARAVTSVRLNNIKLKPYLKGTLSTPHIYELTDYIKADNTLELVSDNSYPSMPAEAIKYSSAATDETQTNWNGILGYIRLRTENENFISGIRVYPKDGKIEVKVEIDVADSYEGTIFAESAALKKRLSQRVCLGKGIQEVVFEACEPVSGVLLWDEYEGSLYEMTAGGEGLEEKKVTFGVRFFDGRGGHLRNNGHRIFLRGESNCCVFPETGHMPFGVREWLEIMERYKSYGINCVRFHSHCPPEAAFCAADRLGMFVQPELSHWDPKAAFGTPESACYYELELRQILYCYANHPSFVMLTLGNELHVRDEDLDKMDRLVKLAKQLDNTRLYANGSNAFYGLKGTDKGSDFYTSCGFFDSDIRGTNAGMKGYINNHYPDAKCNYNAALQRIREVYDKPVFSFEVGQYEVLPDFAELSEFNGVTQPDNIGAVKKAVEEAGFIDDWTKRAEVTGELSRLAYREEIEAAMRTEEMSGISLLGLQDFTGQGTALVGMLNPHLEPKPYDFAKPERFREFFASVLPLVLLDKYTYFEDETLRAEVVLANYGRSEISGSVSYELWEAVAAENKTVGSGKAQHTGAGESGQTEHAEAAGSEKLRQIGAGKIRGCVSPCGGLTSLGIIETAFSITGKPRSLVLKVSVGAYSNKYNIWVYPRVWAAAPETVKATGSLAEALVLLKEGHTVFLEPELNEKNFTDSIETCFTTDFWSVGTFPSQDGYMGCMPEPSHPVFEGFPTRFYPEWQWWIITKARAMVIPKTVKPLLEVLDCYARLRRLAFLFEGRVGSGRLLVSSLGLRGKQQYPEARAFLNSIYLYMASEKFDPQQELTEDVLKSVLV